MLIGVCVWGFYSYKSMPQRKDPDTPVKTAVAITAWPGVNAEKVEQLVTRKIEEKIAQNANVEKIRSISRTNVSVVYVDLDENFPGKQIGKEFDDIALKLDSIKDLPDGAGPIQFIKDFGDTSALMGERCPPCASLPAALPGTRSCSMAATTRTWRSSSSGGRISLRKGSKW